VREGLGIKDKIKEGTPEHVIHRHGVGLLLRQEIYNYGATVTFCMEAWVINESMAHSLMVPVGICFQVFLLCKFQPLQQFSLKHGILTLRS